MNLRIPCLHITLAATLVAVGLLGCRSGPPRGDPASLTTTATVTRGSMADVVQVVGQVVAVNSGTLTFGTVGGKVLEVYVRPGQVVEKGQPLVRIDTRDQERQLREAQADLKVAEAVLVDAQRTSAGVELVRAQADLAVAEAELALAKLKLDAAKQAGLAPLEDAVADAQAALQSARDQLRQTELGGNQSSIRTLEYQQAFFQRVLRDARPGDDTAEIRRALTAVERDLAGARASHDEALRAARDAVTKAEEQLAKAQASLARAQKGEEDPTLSLRLAYEQASATVEKARKRVNDLQGGGDSETVKAAKTAHEAALARVESARAAIDASTLKAPFAGVVFSVFVKVDDQVLPTTNVLYLADPKELRVQAQATEMDIPRLNVGQAVRITFDAYPGRVFSGELLSLPIRGREAGGMSTYPIETSLSHEAADIRPGTLANVRVVIGEKHDVLMVPVAAIQYRLPDQTFVTIRTPDGATHEQEVEVGLNDGIMAEVQSGLSEGQTVVVPLVPPLDPRQFVPGGMPGPVRIERVG